MRIDHIVVTGGTYKFYHAGHINLTRIAPWIITSVPAAWLGGYINISEFMFIGLLGVSLFLVAIRMFWFKKEDNATTAKKHHTLLPPAIGIALGLIAGLVGIGGGIFLAPILYLLRWDSAQKIAATCSVFILVNSFAGLSGQIMKLNNLDLVSNISAYWMLFPTVFVGGLIGSTLSTKHLNQTILKNLTAILVLYVSLQLIWRWWGMT